MPADIFNHNIRATRVDPLYDCPHPTAPRHINTRYAVELHREGVRGPVAVDP